MAHSSKHSAHASSSSSRQPSFEALYCGESCNLSTDQKVEEEPELPYIDMNVGLEAAGGDIVVMDELINIFLSSARKRFQMIKEALLFKEHRFVHQYLADLYTSSSVLGLRSFEHRVQSFKTLYIRNEDDFLSETCQFELERLCSELKMVEFRWEFQLKTVAGAATVRKHKDEDADASMKGAAWGL